MIYTSPCDLGAVEARVEIKAGRLSVRDLLESCIARIETVNPKVNAVVATDYDAARATADAMGRTRTGQANLPALFGLPVLVKDLIETKGLTTSYGSLCFQTNVPDTDGDIVRRLREAGAIILGKTNTPEFGAGANTFNKVYGATRNPYDPTLTCGGSSGGSAVAVACGMAPLAIGSDFGGSLRIPASFCGVVGMRPTPGRVPCSALAVCNSPLWTEGPMARSVEDAALCLSAIEGAEPGDPRSASLPSSSALDSVDLNDLRVGVSTDFGIATLDDEVRALANNRLTVLAEHFSAKQTVTPDLSAAPNAFRVIRVTDVCATAYEHGVETDPRLGDNICANLAEAGSITLSDAARATAEHSELLRRFQAIFNEVDVVLAPATGVSPFPVDMPYPETINGLKLNNYTAWYALTWVISLTGCPVVSIPCGTDHNGLPFGIQVIAPRHQDSLALSVAQKLSSAISTYGFGRTQQRV